MMQIKKEKTFYSSLIILQSLIFGISFIAVKNLLIAGVPTFFLNAIRFLIGTIFLFVFSKVLNLSKTCVAKYGKNKFVTLKELIGGLITGAVLAAAYALQTLGANTTSPAKNGLFTDLFVIYVPILSMIFLSRKFSIKTIISAILAIVGVMLVLNVFAETPTFVIGDLFSIICGIIFSAHFILLEIYSAKQSEQGKSLNPYNFTTIQLLVVALINFVISLSTEIRLYITIDWGKSIGWLLFLGIVSSAFAYTLQFFAQEKISADLTALLSCSESIFTLIISLFFGFDQFNWIFILGAIILIVAMILATINTNRNNGEANATKDNK